jgi:glucose-1-phosphate adenylyltransferase
MAVKIDGGVRMVKVTQLVEMGDKHKKKGVFRVDEVLAIILAGGAGERLSVLTAERTKPAVPFGGRYRVIDFTLSNCVNSGIYQVAVLTQFNPRSLVEHIGNGKPWDLDRKAPKGVWLLQPFLSRTERDWYKGTADAVYQNLYFVAERKPQEVLILSGDHVYTMRYEHLIEYHRLKDADVTIGVVEVPWEQASRFGIVTMDDEGQIIEFAEKLQQPQNNLASMGIYVFNDDILLECLEEDAQREESGHDFGKDILPEIIGKYRVYGYLFRGYWRDVGTIESYWQANMDLIVDLPQFNLYDRETLVHTLPADAPPVKLGPKAQVSRSLVEPGCIINGVVENSILSPGVYVEEDATVRDSIVFSNSSICRGAIVDRCIIDKQVYISSGCYIGYGDNYIPNPEEPENLSCGITVVGKGVRVPAGVKIGRNCKIGSWVEGEDFSLDFIPSGSSVARKAPRRFQL